MTDYTPDEAAAEAAREQIARQRLALDDLREENARLERMLQAPLTLKDMRVAWEAAEVPTGDTPIREGDEVILPVFGGYLVRPATAPEEAGIPAGNVRILFRAPKREPWADLADVLRTEIDLESDPGGIAHALHLKGWRKGGDGDE